jgi:signal transduction histidine kinase
VICSTAALLGEAREALVVAREAAQEARDLDDLRYGIDQLTDGASTELAALSAPFEPTLLEVARVGQGLPLSPGLRNDLRSSVIALRTMVEHLAAPASTRPLGTGQLRLHYRHADLAEHLRSWVEPFRPLASVRDIRLEVDAPASSPGTVDLPKIETVVLNLLFNAFKFTPTQGRVVVRLEAAPDEARLSVSDDGPAVPDVEWHAIFDRARQFERNVFPPQEALGFNLGHSLAYCLLHGGGLELRRAPGAACSFQARWSMRAPRGVAALPNRAPDATLARRVAEVAARELEAEAGLGRSAIHAERATVLIVESARALHRALVDCLSGSFNTLSAFDGTHGLALCKELRPDLILADSTMAQLEVEDFVRAVRAEPALERVPVLLLINRDDASGVQLLQAGAHDLLCKPFLLQEARARVSGLVAAKQARDILNDALGRRDADLIRLASDVRSHQKALESTLAELRAAREAAERANLVKSNFLRMISHELANPVSALQLLVQALGQHPALPPHALARTERVTRRLHHLVDTMVEWARAESGRFRPVATYIDVVAVLHEVMEELRSYASEKDIELSLDVEAPLAPLLSDRRVVQLILTDLFAFVVQNTARGRIDVAVSGAGGRLTVGVKDSAVRIAPDQLADFFSPLESIADLRWRSGHGSGLGLYVVRDLAHAIDGELELDSSFGGPGNRFVLSLPSLVAQSAKRVRASAPAAAPETGARP